MSATIIQFDQTVMEEPKTEVKCSFCGKPTTKSLSSGDNTKHICPTCAVKCAELMKD